MKKAIKIDVEAQDVYYIEIGDYTTIYPAIGNGCELFTVPFECENRDSLYCDDEGCLQDDIKGGFTFLDFRPDFMIVGNAVILGCDDEGESVDALSTVEEIRQRVQFISKELATDYAIRVQNTPPQFYFM